MFSEHPAKLHIKITEAYSKEQPYNDLSMLLPDKSAWETYNVYKNLTEARVALAELKGRLPIIPNPLMLINTLVLQEAKDSSTIENIFTTNDALYKAFSAPRSRRPTRKQKKCFVTGKLYGMRL